MTPEAFTLYFFCSTAAKDRSASTVFVHTLLYQILKFSALGKKETIIKSFFHHALDTICKAEESRKPELSLFREDDSLDGMLGKVLHDMTAIWDALGAILMNKNKNC